MKSLRRRLTWILFLILFFLPLPCFFLWFHRQVGQQRLDHALIQAIQRKDTAGAIALLDQGADANTTDKPYHPMTFQSTLMEFWKRIKSGSGAQDEPLSIHALLLPYRYH